MDDPILHYAQGGYRKDPATGRLRAGNGLTVLCAFGLASVLAEMLLFGFTVGSDDFERVVVGMINLAMLVPNLVLFAWTVHYWGQHHLMRSQVRQLFLLGLAGPLLALLNMALCFLLPFHLHGS